MIQPIVPRQVLNRVVSVFCVSTGYLKLSLMPSTTTRFLLPKLNRQYFRKNETGFSMRLSSTLLLYNATLKGSGVVKLCI